MPMTDGNDVSVYVLTHKRVGYDLRYDDWHIPLQVGADVFPDDICELKDNTGDNISCLNEAFWETTGIYWIWKNREPSKYVGQEHYRRHFALKKNECIEILKDHDIIVTVPMVFPMTVERQYEQCHIPDDIHAVENIVSDMFPDYYYDYVRFIKSGNRLYNANSYITTSENYDRINEFVFSILFEFQRRSGIFGIEDWRMHAAESRKESVPDDHRNEEGMSWERYQTGVCGFLYERLFTLFVMHNFKRVFEIGFAEPPARKSESPSVLLCTIARLENDYIREFVEYYRRLGVTNICLYDNNHEGEENFKDVIGDYIARGFVILKDYRSKRTPFQLDAYNECYSEYGGKYDWIMFLDVDEFVFLNGFDTIGEYLSNEAFAKYSVIHLNWLMYGDCGLETKTAGGVLDRFTNPLPLGISSSGQNVPDTFHVKSIVRGGLPDLVWNNTAHTPSTTMACCNSHGERCSVYSPFCPYDFRWAGIRHFSTKTAEEYADKVLKGSPDKNRPDYGEWVANFFKRNEVTKNKVDIFRRKLGVDASNLLERKGDK